MDSMQPFFAIVLVMLLLGGALLLLRKRGAATFRLPRFAAAGPRRMEIVERLALSPHHALHLVRVGDRSIVIATAPSSCELLCEEAPE